MPDSHSPQVELFGRAAVSGGRTRQRAVETRLVHHSWQSHVRTPVDEDGPAAEAIAWYDRFAAWADRNDASVEPFFTRRERESVFTGTCYEEYVFPVLAVAVVRDGEVTEVAPRLTSTGEEVDIRDVVEALADAATAGTPTPAPVASE